MTVTACSDASRALGEPLAGTAPEASAWLVLEQPGPWGRRALTESHLDPVLGKALEVAARAHGARVALVRRPGRHPDDARARRAQSRRVWVASTTPGASWLVGGWVDDVTALSTLAWPGDREAVQASLPGLRSDAEPLLLVCTNARRDVCCAIRGRALAETLSARLGDRLWETTHLSGHRFAPTAVLLPHGLAYGRLTPDTAARVFDQARVGRFVADNYRGRSTFSRPGQAAEAAVRRTTVASGLDDLDVVSVQHAEGSWQTIVAHRDGRRWIVDLRDEVLEPPRPESCGATPVTPTSYIASHPLPMIMKS